MLFGSRRAFALEIQPLNPTWERRYLPERTAWAALGIVVDDNNITAHVDPDTSQAQDSVNIPLAPLADWFVRVWPFVRFEERPAAFAESEEPHANLLAWGDAAPSPGLDEERWLWQREEWWSRHFVLPGTDDVYLPNMAFVRHEDVLIVEWRRRRRPDGEPCWVHQGGLRAVPWATAEDAVAQFVAFVADWLRREGLANLYGWAVQSDPIKEIPFDLRGSLELYTARSVGQLVATIGGDLESLARTLGLPDQATDPAASPVTQALRDLPPGEHAELRHPLEWLRDATNEPADSRALSMLTELRSDALQAARGPGRPERAGYASGASVRASLGLDGRPIDDVPALIRLFGIEASTSPVELLGTHMICGHRLGGRGGAILLRSARTSESWASRFEYAKALGHILLDPPRGGTVGAASSPYSIGYRRRRAGAFAAELLLPESALRRITGGELDGAAKPGVFRGMLRDYGIGAKAAAYHLWNHGFVRQTVRDDLVEDYSIAG